MNSHRPPPFRTAEITPDNFSADRRRMVLTSGLAGVGAFTGAMPAWAQSTPKKGGALRMGMAGGSPSDSLDPRTYADSIPIAYSLMIWNMMVEIDAKGNAVPELAESWESKPGATEWIFNIRRGITFGSGKPLDADDVIYSINLHRGESKSPAKSLLSGIKTITKTSSHQIKFELTLGNADLPYVFSDYHLIIVPNGTTDFAKADGTGAYTLEDWKPGVRIFAKRKPGTYWKPNRGNFETVELRYIGDAAARTRALLTGQVDAINRIDPKSVAFVSKNNTIRISRTQGVGQRYSFVAQTDRDPFKNHDLMLALKYGIDRKRIVDNVYSGYATIGNDQLIGPMNRYFDARLPVRPYDPDKAKFHMNKSGYSGKIELVVSDGAFSGAVDAGVIFQESAKKADINIELKRVSSDGYWDNVWLKAPFCAAYWGNRPTADQQLSTAFLAGGAWNDTHYSNPKFDKIVIAARAELDETKRRAMYSEAQSMISEEAGMICFAVGDTMDACTTKLMGLDPNGRFDMADQRLAEKGWFV
jgi:peptide/nickel transport system substrate-binding protein